MAANRKTLHKELAGDMHTWNEQKFNALAKLIREGNLSFAQIKNKLGRPPARSASKDGSVKGKGKSQGDSQVRGDSHPQVGNPQNKDSGPKMAAGQDEVPSLMAMDTSPPQAPPAAPAASVQGINIAIPTQEVSQVEAESFTAVVARKSAPKRPASPLQSPSHNKQLKPTNTPQASASTSTNPSNTPTNPPKDSSTQQPANPTSNANQQKTAPLFIEFHDPADEWKYTAHMIVKDKIKSHRITPAKNILIYPKDEKCRDELLKVTHDQFIIRPTKGKSLREQANRPNLFAVVRNVPQDFPLDKIIEKTKCTAAVRMHSAARNCPIASVKVTFATQEDKDLALKHGLKVFFSKFKVEDYKTSRPKQCINCNKFDHLVKDCPTKDTLICKKCSGAHKHQECTADEQKCSNCGDNHPATFSGCPAYKQARVVQQAKQMTFAQKVAAPSTPLQSTRLAYALSQGIYHALKHILPDSNISEDAITEAVCVGVTHAFKTSTNIQSVYSLK